MTHRKNTNFIDELNAEFSAETPDAAGTSDESGGKPEDFAKLLSESFKKPTRKFSVGDKVRAEILVLGKEDVFVATGAQADGVLARRELNEPDGSCKYKVGDVLDLYVTQVRGTELRVSRNPTEKNLAEDLEDAFDLMMPVAGRVVEVCKGGVRVNVKGKIAFCPISQLDVSRTETGEEFVGKSLEFRITKFESGGKNIVVSRRQLLEEERELSSASFIEEHKDGEIVSGKVTRLEKFGAFVELAPGLDGLVHISELAWSRVGEPSEIVRSGQEVQVKILKREVKEGRVKISLSLKQAMPKEDAPAPKAGAAGTTAAVPNKADPWSKYTPGTQVEGTVNRRELYGLFVQLEPGITGLLHKSQIEEHPEFQFEKVKLNDKITVQVADVRKDERRISLTLPQDPERDSWKQYAQAESPKPTLGGAFGAALKAALEKKK
jgi:small subunit ribosomal protein S1